MSVSGDAPRDASQVVSRDLPHTTPHHTTPITTPSSRGMALADTIPEVRYLYAKHLAAVVVTLRPDWPVFAIEQAINSDDRPWRTVVLAAINGAADPDIRHPNGLRFVNATSKGAPTPTPPKYVGCTCPDCEGRRTT